MSNVGLLGGATLLLTITHNAHTNKTDSKSKYIKPKSELCIDI